MLLLIESVTMHFAAYAETKKGIHTFRQAVVMLQLMDDLLGKATVFKVEIEVSRM